jgi:hypothetical protein
LSATGVAPDSPATNVAPINYRCETPGCGREWGGGFNDYRCPACKEPGAIISVA